ncbi:hypothetical protein ACTFIZ_011011 [Dictyostelium cf. discoideum]
MTEAIDQIQNQIKQFYNFNPIQKINYEFEDNSENETDDENSNKKNFQLKKISDISFNTLEKKKIYNNNNNNNNNNNKLNNICNYKRTLSSSSLQQDIEETRKKIKSQFHENDFENGFGNFQSWLNNSIPYFCKECNGNHEPPQKKLNPQDIPLFTIFEPLTFIREVNKVIHIELEIAGVDKDDVKVDLTNNILTIVAKKKSVYPLFQNMCEFKRHEKSIGVYKRVLEFNSNTVDKDTIKARYVNGILLITVNKFL